MGIIEKIDTIRKTITSKKMQKLMVEVRAGVIEMDKELQVQHALYWFHPMTVTPENGEIVVIACNVEAEDGRVASILQTAIYEQRANEGGVDGVQEFWHCGQPFVLLRRWCRLPLVPEDTIIVPKVPGLIL